MPILTRSNVGDGYLRVADREEHSRRYLQLEFGAGSLPDRAAGLNRLGLMEETVEEGPAGITSASYFGFMTASNEKNLEEARSALKEGGPATINAVRGRIEHGRVTNRLVKIAGLAQATWAEHERLRPLVERRLLENEREGEATAQAADCGTFLHAVHCALRREGNSKRGFIHNGKVHWLHAEHKGGGELAAEIYSSAGQTLSTFKLWCDGENKPVRFEFRPRSFLRLTFERVSD